MNGSQSGNTKKEDRRSLRPGHVGGIPTRRTMSEAALTACFGSNSPDINQVSFTPSTSFVSKITKLISGDGWKHEEGSKQRQSEVGERVLRSKLLLSSSAASV